MPFFSFFFLHFVDHSQHRFIILIVNCVVILNVTANDVYVIHALTHLSMK